MSAKREPRTEHPPASDVAARLAALADRGLQRSTRLIAGAQGPRVLLEGRPVTLLCSNNYLGLSDHPRVREAAMEATMRWGVGAGASRLVSGTMTVHRELEEQLAEFKRTAACTLFGSGYLANIGAIGALAGRGDVVFSDELNHASIVDGCRLSRAEVVVYRHLDTEHLAWCLDRDGSGSGGSGGGPGGGLGRDSRSGADPSGGHGRRRLIVTDSVFSMDGDIAPLAEMVELARRHRARLLVDEAHATGALGPGGRGVLAREGLEGEVDAIVGTLGKALGSYGAYVCSSEEIARYLLNVARPLIFSTAPPPPALAAAAAALELLQRRPRLVEALHDSARVLRDALAAEGFGVAPGEMHIVPLVVGDAASAMRMCEAAIERGVFAQAIRPPTVPAGTSRLRLAVMASHEADDLVAAARSLREAAEEVGIDPGDVGATSVTAK